MELGPIFRSIRRNKSRFVLIVLEVALTLAVVTNCVMLIADARRQMAHPSGFDDEHLIHIESTPLDVKFKEHNYSDQVLAQDLAALRATPGVRAVSHTEFVPWSGGGRGTIYGALGPNPQLIETQAHGADAAIIETVGVQLIEGRSFTPEEIIETSNALRDLEKAARARTPDGMAKDKITLKAITTRAYAEMLFGNGPYVGKLFQDAEGDLYEIVGVMDPFYSPYQGNRNPVQDRAVFVGFNSADYSGSNYVVRTTTDAGPELEARLEELLLLENPMRSLKIRSVTAVKSVFFGQEALLSTMLTAVSVLLLFVTSLGIIGLTSFSVTARTKQIGVRRALGARKRDILSYFLTENWVVTTLGLAAGSVAAYALNLGLMSVVNAGRLPGAIIVAVALGLCFISLLATLWPALRGARVSPSIATRNV